MIKYIAGLLTGVMIGIFLVACAMAANDGNEISARSDNNGK